MAFSAHKDEESIKEHYDSPEELDEKIGILVKLIRKSKHFVIFTGAGISTDAGIPDFRGPEGVWTLKAQGRRRKGPTTDSLCAIPTATHMSMVELQNRGVLKYVISQNCDGLHRRSGILPERISELHGNGNIEHCEKCGHEYLRDYDTDRVQRGSHWTGRRCVLPNCRGKLLDSTIDFGQSLPVRPLKRAEKNSNKSDLHMVLGSSLTVRPACHMPKYTARRGGDLVIVNLQKTPLDGLATLRIFHKCDVVMKEVMKRLDFEIPPFLLKRNFAIRHSVLDNNWNLDIRGVDYGTSGMEIPASTLNEVDVQAKKKYVLTEEPFLLSVPAQCKSAKLQLHMYGHYAEPPVDLELQQTDDHHIIYRMTYNPMTGEWARLAAEKVDEGESEKEKETGKEKEKEKEKESDMDIDFVPSVIKASCFQTTDAVPRSGLWGTLVHAKGPKHKSLIVSCGGSNTRKSRSAISVLDLKTRQWHVPRKEDSDMPFLSGRRWGHTASVLPSKPSKVYLIGGWNASSQFNDVHVYDCKTNKVVRAKVSKGSTPPTHRAGHSATVCGRSIVVFGGARCEKGPYAFFNDVFVYNTEMESWTELKCTGDIPCPRAQHSALLLGDNTLVVVGGYTGQAIVHDVYALDLTTREWKRIEAKGTPPPDNNDATTADFRVYPARHTTTLLTPKSGETPFLLYIGEEGVYALNTANWTWDIAETDTQVLPPALVCHSAVAISRSEMLIMGGTSKDTPIAGMYIVEML